MFCLELAAWLCPIRIRRQSGPVLKPGVFSRDLPRARVSMAGLERNWTRTLAFAVLLMGAGTAGFTQSPATLPAEDTTTGSLTGKLTDLYSRPLEGVPVVVRNQATGAETRTITTKNGFYRFSRLEPGEYTVTAESPQLGRGQLEDIAVAAGYEARVQTAMELAHTPPTSPVLAAFPSEERPKVEEQPWLNRPVLETEALPVSEIAWTAEPLRLLPLREQWVRAEISQTTAIEVNAALETEPLQTLALAGQSLPNSAPPAPPVTAPAVVLGSQVSEARPGAPGSPANGPTAPALSNTMSAAELQALPVSGRRWQEFVLDNTPTSTTRAGGQGEITLRGAGQPAEITVDGVSRGLAFGRTNESGQGSQGRGALGQGENPAGIAQVGKGGHGLVLNEAAIRTVETVAGNVEAAADRAAGGRMNVETQRGANELHGQGFLYDRQNIWGAQNPFTQWIKETTPANGTAVPVPVFTPESYTPPDHETTWGIGVGSRIRRNKLFWFAALDGYQRNDPGLATVKHPYLLQPEPSNTCANPPCTAQTGFFVQPANDQMQVLSARLGLSSVNPVAEGLAAYSK